MRMLRLLGFCLIVTYLPILSLMWGLDLIGSPPWWFTAALMLIAWVQGVALLISEAKGE